MKINLVKDDEKELVIEFDTMEFTIPDMIADELLEDSNVEYAGVSKDHPETGKPVMAIRGKNPKKALLSAIERLDENFTELKSQISKKK